jgi:hypothetical protein
VTELNGQEWSGLPSGATASYQEVRGTLLLTGFVVNKKDPKNATVIQTFDPARQPAEDGSLLPFSFSAKNVTAFNDQPHTQ